MFNSRVGLCIKDLEFKVFFQNEMCLNFCGNREGEVCRQGCLSTFKKNNKADSFIEGLTNIGLFQARNGIVEGLVINDNEHLTSVLYPAQKVCENIIEKFKARSLSETEMKVVIAKLEGWKNREIAEKLFISHATLKTHINNIYKKIPNSYKKMLMIKCSSLKLKK